MTVRLDTAKLDRIIATFPKESEQVVKSGALAVQGLAANAAPVDTGALRNSIKATRKDDLLWWVHDGEDYGIYQELGTSRMSAHPFMVPAVERAQKAYTALWIALFNRL